MWSFRDSKDDAELRQTVLTFSVGAVGGLVVGLLLARRGADRMAQQYGSELRDRAAGGRYTASGLHDGVADHELTGLEDAVIDAFLAHPVLSERGIDVGAISRGIVELSGSVYTEDESDTAVRVANSVAGVQTVVNRLEVEEEAEHLDETRRRFEDGDPALTETRWEGRRVGMGRMRQGRQTEPDRPDDSQHQIERALLEADRDEWIEDHDGHENTRVAARPEDDRPDQQPDFEHDDLDNQDPHRRDRAPNTLDEQPQEFRSGTRVGEGMKPGTELELEASDVPVKPHGDAPAGEDAERRG
jgi:hypothetical protein